MSVYRNVNLKRELVDRVESFTLSHPELGYTSNASFIAAAVNEKLADLEPLRPPSQPAPAPPGPSVMAKVPSLPVGALEPARTARGRQLKTDGPELDVERIRHEFKSLGRLPDVAGSNERTVGIERVKILAERQGFDLEDQDAAEVYERVVTSKGART